jgi:MFS family permease
MTARHPECGNPPTGGPDGRIGLLSTYATIGAAAPIILVLLRFAQGVGVGGEWGGAVLLSSEFGDPRRRGFWSSAAQLGPPAGDLLSNGALAVLTPSMSDEAFLAWGWRIAFLLSAVLVGFGLWIRLKLEDTPVFRAIKERGDQPAAPVRDVFRTQRRALLAGVLSRIGPDVTYALFTVFVLTYATTVVGMSRGQVLSRTRSRASSAGRWRRSCSPPCSAAGGAGSRWRSISSWQGW